MKKILIIGATSAIAKSAARLWAQEGSSLYLVARDQERLESISNDLKVRGASSVFICDMDANDYRSHKAMLVDVSEKFGVIDILLIAHGSLPDQLACQSSVDMTIHEINNNALSVIALLTLVANIFEKQKKGTIAVISSIAGDRGRKSNYVYGSAKALVTAFMSGLRQRLHSSGVSVLTIKPGFVDTPMTAAFKKNFLWAQPQYVAIKILDAIENRADVIYVPRFWLLVMMLIKNIPEVLFKKINGL